MKTNLKYALPALTICALSLNACQGNIKKNRPNVVFILADDLGYGDISCLGQNKFRTPNIDRLISQGKFFTQHYSGSAVSAPSRSCIVTGLHTGHTPIRGNKECPEEGQYPMPDSVYTVFRLFKEAGYKTGVFGKWGLGAPGTEGSPENQGVDEFFGYNCQRLAHNYYPHYLWDNTRKVYLEGNKDNLENDYAPYMIHEKALQFIRGSRKRPFFLWYTTTIPHAELKLPENKMSGFLDADSCQPEKSFNGCDEGNMYKKGGYGSQTHCHAAFAAMVTLLDEQVGEIIETLDSLGIAENTIVIFTSDNGAHAEGGADPVFFDSNGEFRGIKRDLYEGGIRTPFSISWPNVVEAGTRTDHISAFWDFLPTMAEVLDVDLDVTVDGISYLPTLIGAGEQKKHEYLYWELPEFGGRQAVRKGNWKAVRYDFSRGGRIQLYDLSEDIGEENDLAEMYPDKVAEFDSIMRSARTESDIFKL